MQAALQTPIAPAVTTSAGKNDAGETYYHPQNDDQGRRVQYTAKVTSNNAFGGSLGGPAPVTRADSSAGLVFSPDSDATFETNYDDFLVSLGLSPSTIGTRQTGLRRQQSLIDTGGVVSRGDVVGAIPFVVGNNGKVYVALAQATNDYNQRNIPLLPKGFADTVGTDGRVHGRGNAIKEAWEETGLILKDVQNDGITSRGIRYYPMLIEDGHPALMGWESQHVQLIELDQAVMNGGATMDGNTSNSVRSSVDALREFQQLYQLGKIRTSAPAPAPAAPVGPLRSLNTPLSDGLRGARPKYQSFGLDFSRDMDKAAFVARNGANRSKRDADYVRFVQSITGWTEAQVRAHGDAVAQSIQQLARNAPLNSTLSVYAVTPAIPFGAAAPSAAAPAAPQASGSITAKVNALSQLTGLPTTMLGFTSSGQPAVPSPLASRGNIINGNAGVVAPAGNRMPANPLASLGGSLVLSGSITSLRNARPELFASDTGAQLDTYGGSLMPAPRAVDADTEALDVNTAFAAAGEDGTSVLGRPARTEADKLYVLLYLAGRALNNGRSATDMRSRGAQVVLNSNRAQGVFSQLDDYDLSTSPADMARVTAIAKALFPGVTDPMLLATRPLRAVYDAAKAGNRNTQGATDTQVQSWLAEAIYGTGLAQAILGGSASVILDTDFSSLAVSPKSIWKTNANGPLRTSPEAAANIFNMAISGRPLLAALAKFGKTSETYNWKEMLKDETPGVFYAHGSGGHSGTNFQTTLGSPRNQVVYGPGVYAWSSPVQATAAGYRGRGVGNASETVGKVYVTSDNIGLFDTNVRGQTGAMLKRNMGSSSASAAAVSSSLDFGMDASRNDGNKAGIRVVVSMDARNADSAGSYPAVAVGAGVMRVLSTYYRAVRSANSAYDYFSGYNSIAVSGKVAYQSATTSAAAQTPDANVPLSSTAVDALQNNELGVALGDIAKNSANKMNRVVAARLQTLIGGRTSVTVDPDLVTDTGDKALGAASTNGLTLWINPNGGFNEETLLHEGVHAAAETVLNAPENTLTPAQLAAKRELERIWAAAKANLQLGEAATQSLSEFVAEAMSNTQLQTQMAAQPWSLSKMWSLFKVNMLKLIGVSNPTSMLDATVAAMDTIFSVPGTTPNGGGPDGGRRFQTARSTAAVLAASQAGQPASPASATRGVGAAVGQATRTLMRGGSAPQAQTQAAGAVPFLSRIGDTIVETFSDNLLPMVRWVQNLKVPPVLQQAILGAMYTAPNVRDNITRQAMEEHGGEALNQALGQMLTDLQKKPGNADKRDEDVIRDAGYWVTAKYAMVKNARMLAAARQEEADALTALNTAIANNAPQTQIDSLRDAYAEAAAAADDREFAMGQSADVTAHLGVPLPAGAQGPTRPVGLAGGMNTAQAQEFMLLAERQFGRAALEAMAKHVYNLNAYRMAVDIESGRIPPGQAAQYSPELLAALPEMEALALIAQDPKATQPRIEAARKKLVDKLKATSQYVPTTGDPSQGFEQDVLGSGFKTPNVAKDKRLLGRVESIADNGISASLAGMQRSAAAAGWNRFTGLIAQAYNQMTPAQRVAAGMKEVPITALDRLSDNMVIHGDKGYTINNGQELQALRKENVDGRSALLRLAETPNKWFAYAATQMNPAFGFINMARDVWERSENLRTKALTTERGGKVNSTRAAQRMIELAASGAVFSDLVKTIWNGRANTKYGTLLREFEQYGGGGSKYAASLATERANLVSDIENTRSAPRKAFRALGKVISKWNDVFDSVSALSAYAALREQGMSKEAAAASVLDLMNFRKTGSAMPAIRALWAFAQPAVTGGTNLATMLKTPMGRKRLGQHVLALAALLPLLGSLAGDDEELGKNRIDMLDDYTKDRFLPIPLGGELIAKLPLGFGLPVLANILVRQAMGFAKGDESLGEAVSETVSRGIIPAFTPFEDVKVNASEDPATWFAQTFAPTFLKPVANLAINKTGLGGKIVNDAYLDKNQFKSEQGSPLTAEAYRDFASGLRQTFGIDMAPEQVRELARGYSLGALRYATQLFIDNPNKELQGRVTENPLVKAFVTRDNPNAVLIEFGKFEDKGLDVMREANAQLPTGLKESERGPLRDQLELPPEKRAVLDLYEDWIETEKGFRKQSGALTRAGVTKGIDPQRAALRAQKEAAQVDIIRRFNQLQ